MALGDPGDGLSGMVFLVVLIMKCVKGKIAWRRQFISGLLATAEIHRNLVSRLDPGQMVLELMKSSYTWPFTSTEIHPPSDAVPASRFSVGVYSLSLFHNRHDRKAEDQVTASTGLRVTSCRGQAP